MTPLLQVEDLSVTYPAAGGARVRALDGVSVAVAPGEVLGIVGESGCGKSTLGRAVMRLIEPSAGRILFEGRDLAALDRQAMTGRRRHLGMVFQDPFGSLNPRHRVGALVREPLDVHRIGTGAEREARVTELLARVGLDAGAARRYPHEFSGGQRQRIAIARAIAAGPKLVVADEPVSALDVSIQSQIINLIQELRRAFGLSLLFISHDLSVVRHVSERIAVMYLGRVVETGSAGPVMERPAHPYTRALLSAIPRPDGRRQARIVLRGELPDPASPPSGCAFRTRCPHAMPVCTAERPALVPRRIEDGSVATAACHLHAAV